MRDLPGALDPNVNAGDIGVILSDLVDLGVVERVEANPPQWRTPEADSSA